MSRKGALFRQNLEVQGGIYSALECGEPESLQDIFVGQWAFSCKVCSDSLEVAVLKTVVLLSGRCFDLSCGSCL